MPRRPGAPRRNANAVTHGLTATASLHLLPGEDLNALTALWRASATLATSPLDAYLVARFAGIIWRLRRVPALEAAALADITHGRHGADPDLPAGDIDAVLDNLLASSGSTLELDLLMRYEAHLQRCLLSTLAALHAIRQLGADTCPAPSASTATRSPETYTSPGTP